MAYWIFKYNPEKYDLVSRLTDPSPETSWIVTRYRDSIAPGDLAFLYETGKRRGIRAVIRIVSPPLIMPQARADARFWIDKEKPENASHRVHATFLHRDVDLPIARLKSIPGLEGLSVFHGFQQGTNFPVTPEQGQLLMSIICDNSN